MAKPFEFIITSIRNLGKDAERTGLITDLELSDIKAVTIQYVNVLKRIQKRLDVLAEQRRTLQKSTMSIRGENPTILN